MNAAYIEEAIRIILSIAQNAMLLAGAWAKEKGVTSEEYDKIINEFQVRFDARIAEQIAKEKSIFAATHVKNDID